LAYRQYDSLRDLVVTYKIRNRVDKTLSDDGKTLDHYSRAIVDYSPDNIYQNLSRNAGMVTTVFLAQVFLIVIVITDAFQKMKITCFDTVDSGCPVVGTMGSWFLFVLGTLLQNVYLMGPSGGFGSSQQNPSFWLVALLAVKKSEGAKFSWIPERGLASLGGGKERRQFCQCSQNDTRLWARLFVDTIINGFGYRVLFHSLPILLAARPNVNLVIFVAVGVLYITKLDDSHGDHDIRIEEDSDSTATYGDDGEIMNTMDIRNSVPIRERQENLSIGLIMNNVYREREKHE